MRTSSFPWTAPRAAQGGRGGRHRPPPLFLRGRLADPGPRAAPASGAGRGSFAGPGSAAHPDDGTDDAGEALQREIAGLAPWYDLARTRRGRTTVGISGLPIDRAARHAASYLGASPEAPNGDSITPGMALKRACDDLKAYYYEAAAARPGDLSPPAIDQ